MHPRCINSSERLYIEIWLLIGKRITIYLTQTYYTEEKLKSFRFRLTISYLETDDGSQRTRIQLLSINYSIPSKIIQVRHSTTAYNITSLLNASDSAIGARILPIITWFSSDRKKKKKRARRAHIITFLVVIFSWGQWLRERYFFSLL